MPSSVMFCISCSGNFGEFQKGLWLVEFHFNKNSVRMYDTEQMETLFEVISTKVWF